MSIEDGYFLAAELERCRRRRRRRRSARALQAFEDRRKKHTAHVSQLGLLSTASCFTACPAPLRPLRDLVFDRTPFLQKVIGDDMPAQILSQLAEIDAVERQVRVASR